LSEEIFLIVIDKILFSVMHYIVYMRVKHYWTTWFCIWIQNAQSGFSNVSLKW